MSLSNPPIRNTKPSRLGSDVDEILRYNRQMLGAYGWRCCQEKGRGIVVIEQASDRHLPSEKVKPAFLNVPMTDEVIAVTLGYLSTVEASKHLCSCQGEHPLDHIHLFERMGEYDLEREVVALFVHANGQTEFSIQSPPSVTWLRDLPEADLDLADTEAF